jgi:ferredoxin
MTDIKTHWYILTFRCLYSGRTDVFTKISFEREVLEEQIRARIYQVNCKSCGWNGEVCGFSAIEISDTVEEMKIERYSS